MLSLLDKLSVKDFLIICKKEIKKGNCYFVADRMLKVNNTYKNAKQLLIDIGIMKINQIWEHILTLNVSDCVKVDFDYEKRRDTNSEIFVFKKMINNKNVYIKLILSNNSIIICISFHESY